MDVRSLALLVLLAATQVTAEPAPRFDLRGALQPSATSDDGRFRLRAEARVTPDARTLYL